MEVSPLLVILLLCATALFGKLYFMSRLPVEKKEDGSTVPPCSHKRTQHHYYENPDTGARVCVPVCSDCMVALPPETRTLERFSPHILKKIHQELGDQGYDTTALPYIPVEGTP